MEPSHRDTSCVSSMAMARGNTRSFYRPHRVGWISTSQPLSSRSLGQMALMKASYFVPPTHHLFGAVTQVILALARHAANEAFKTDTPLAFYSLYRSPGITGGLLSMNLLRICPVGSQSTMRLQCDHSVHHPSPPTPCSREKCLSLAYRRSYVTAQLGKSSPLL